MFVVLGKGYGGGGDNGGAEGVIGWNMFCAGDNGGAVSVSLGILLGGGGGGGPCEEWGGGGGQKFELKLFLLFLKASSFDWILISTRFSAFLLKCSRYVFFQYRVLLARNQL